MAITSVNFLVKQAEHMHMVASQTIPGSHSLLVATIVETKSLKN